MAGGPSLVAVMLALTLSLGRAGKPTTIVSRVLRQFSRYIETYTSLGRLGALFAVTTVTIVLGTLAQFSSDLALFVQDTPFVATNIVTLVAGYMSLGGNIPILSGVPLIGSLTAGEFLVLSITLLALGAAMKCESFGQLIRFVRNR